MKERIPRTPFSTPLSGSAKETELRIQNIVTGPKKRPPLLFLALMFSVCIFCGNLVSCQMAEAEAPGAPDTSASVPEDPDVSLPENPPVPWTPVELDARFLQDNECILDSEYDRLTAKEEALLNDLPAGELPREAVDIFHDATRKEYWRDTLLPVAYDEEEDVTVYFVVNPDSMPNVDPLVSPLLWGGDLERRGIVLRHGDRTAYFPLCWEINAKFNSNPLLLVDDLDSDGQPEAALALAWGEGTGCYVEALYIFDLDTMTYTIPDYSEVPLELTLSPSGNLVEVHSGPYYQEVNISELEDRFQNCVEVGNQVQFHVNNGYLSCGLFLDYSCDTLGYLSTARFPIVYEDGAYKLGPAIFLADLL